MEIMQITIPVYAESKDEADGMRSAWVDFSNQLRSKGCVVTAAKTSEALKAWNTNALVRAGILKHYKR